MSVRDAAHVGRTRRLCRRLAETAGSGVELVERAALVTTELANNLVAHAGRGHIYLRATGREVEIVSVDRGPGLGNARRAFRDGFSTGGTGGTGLGAVRRLSHALDFESSERGTVLVCRLTAERSGRTARGPAGLVAPHPGEPEAGDGLLVGTDDGRVLAAVVDGLGHGRLASTAREQAIRSLAEATLVPDPSELPTRMHEVMGGAVGAAASVAVIEPRRRRITFAGIGNVAARLIHPDGGTAHLVTVGGIVGRGPFRVQEQALEWCPGAVLVMHSDGLTARWRPSDYPWARRRDPALLAGVLMRDFQRPRDDASVLVLREAA